MKYLMRFNENKKFFGDFHLYLHPTSGGALFYLIPDEFNDILKSDKDFKIGFWQKNFNDYLAKYYDDIQGSLNGKAHIRYFGKHKLNFSPKEINTYEYKDMYYYEYDTSDIPRDIRILFK